MAHLCHEKGRPCAAAVTPSCPPGCVVPPCDGLQFLAGDGGLAVCKRRAGHLCFGLGPAQHNVYPIGGSAPCAWDATLHDKDTNGYQRLKQDGRKITMAHTSTHVRGGISSIDLKSTPSSCCVLTRHTIHLSWGMRCSSCAHTHSFTKVPACTLLFMRLCSATLSGPCACTVRGKNGVTLMKGHLSLLRRTRPLPTPAVTPPGPSRFHQHQDHMPRRFKI